jgi:hypothetical protein
MYSLLVRLMLLAALIELSFSLNGVVECRSKRCSRRIEGASHDVLSIDWRPISVFPEVAKQFK